MGPQRGVNTAGTAATPAVAAAASAPAGATNAVVATAPAATKASGAGAREAAAATAIAQKNNCTACHAPDKRVVGPSWAEIAKKHEGKVDYLAGKIRAGGSGVWGAIPMPPQTIAEEDVKRIAGWLAAGAAQ